MHTQNHSSMLLETHHVLRMCEVLSTSANRWVRVPGYHDIDVLRINKPQQSSIAVRMTRSDATLASDILSQLRWSLHTVACVYFPRPDLSPTARPRPNFERASFDRDGAAPVHATWSRFAGARTGASVQTCHQSDSDEQQRGSHGRSLRSPPAEREQSTRAPALAVSRE